MGDVTGALIDPLDLVSPELYGERGFPHETWAILRREDPVHWCEPEGVRPFCVLSKHADLKYVASNPALFSSRPRWPLQPSAAGRETLATRPDAADQGGMPLRMLVTMDPPEHRTYRNLASPYFRPRIVSNLEDRIDEITRLLFDRLSGTDRDVDVVEEFAQWHPLRMLCEVLGVSADREELILRLTNE